jgi:hypothetical protein
MTARAESVSEGVAEQPNEDVHAAENCTTASDKPMYTTPEWQRAPGRWSAKEAELLKLMRSKVLHVTLYNLTAAALFAHDQRAIPQQ